MTVISLEELIALMNETLTQVVRCGICNEPIVNIEKGGIEILDCDLWRLICPKCYNVGREARKEIEEPDIPVRD